MPSASQLFNGGINMRESTSLAALLPTLLSHCRHAHFEIDFLSAIICAATEPIAKASALRQFHPALNHLVAVLHSIFGSSSYFWPALPSGKRSSGRSFLLDPEMGEKQHSLP
jgi:hypothetical protein